MSAEVNTNNVASIAGSIPRAVRPESSQGRRAVEPSSEVVRPERAMPAEEMKSRVEENIRESQEENPSEKLQKMTAHLNDVLSTFDKGIRFEVFDETEQLYVQVVNKQTDEVVKTIPSEEMLSAMARLHDALGMILDTEA